jgi:hypothetical protein
MACRVPEAHDLLIYTVITDSPEKQNNDNNDNDPTSIAPTSVAAKTHNAPPMITQITLSFISYVA